jgi:hypothetical protein
MVALCTSQYNTFRFHPIISFPKEKNSTQIKFQSCHSLVTINHCQKYFTLEPEPNTNPKKVGSIHPLVYFQHFLKVCLSRGENTVSFSLFSLTLPLSSLVSTLVNQVFNCCTRTLNLGMMKQVFYHFATATDCREPL